VAEKKDGQSERPEHRSIAPPKPPLPGDPTGTAVVYNVTFPKNSARNEPSQLVTLNDFFETFDAALKNIQPKDLAGFDSPQSYAQYLISNFTQKYGFIDIGSPGFDLKNADLKEYHEVRLLNSVFSMFYRTYPRFTCLSNIIADNISDEIEIKIVTSNIVLLLRGFLDGNDDLVKIFSQSGSQSKYRQRSELPDPEKPAWAEVNRKPRSKTQINLRLEDEIIELANQAAEKQGVSRTAWMTKAFVNQARSEGWDIPSPERTHTQQEARPTRPRRTQRKSDAFPDPSQSADAEINRRDTAISLRISPALLTEIDRAAEESGTDRTAWFRSAAERFLNAGQPLLDDHHQRTAVSKSIVMRFDPGLLQEIDRQASVSGVTRADWLRRVARWRLDTSPEPSELRVSPAP